MKKALKMVFFIIVFSVLFSFSAFAEMSESDLLSYGFTSIPSTTDLSGTTKDFILLSKESGLIFDKEKFESGGGSYRGGGAGRYSTRYEIPADSIVQNPYYKYFESPIQKYQQPPTPVVTSNGLIVYYVYPSYMGVLTTFWDKQLGNKLSESALSYPFSDSFYYFGTTWPWEITPVASRNIAVMTIWQVPMAGTYTLLYPVSFRSGMYGSAIETDETSIFNDDGLGNYRIYDSNGNAVSSSSDRKSFSANSGHQFASIRTFTSKTSSIAANKFISLECFADPFVFGFNPSVPQYDPLKVTTFPGFDVQFDTDFNVDLFSPVVINVNAPNTAFDFSVNIDDSTYPAYYYTIDNSGDTTIYYYDNSGQVSGSITYNEVTNMYIVYNYSNGVWMEGNDNPVVTPTPGPSTSPLPTLSPAPDPTTNPLFPGYDDDLQDADSVLQNYDDELFEDVNHYKDQLTFNLDEWNEFSSGLDYVRMVFMKIWNNIPTQIITLSLMLGVGTLIIGRGVKMATSKKGEDDV